jgi:hypothetical protein
MGKEKWELKKAALDLALKTKFDRNKYYKNKGLAKSDYFRKMTRQ